MNIVSYIFYWNWKPMHSQNYIPSNKQKNHDPANLNDSTVLEIPFQLNVWFRGLTQQQSPRK